MKKINFLLLLSLVVLALSVGCSKDSIETGGGDGSVVEGVSTVATFKFDAGGATKTRSHTLPTDANEKDLDYKDISILIFQEAGTQLLITKVLAQDVSTTNNKLTVSTTSGQKRIFVFANVGGTMKTELDKLVTGSAKLKNLYDLMSDPYAQKPENTEMGPGFLEMAAGSSGKVTMSNGASTQSLFTLEPDIDMITSGGAATGDATKNSFTITIKRVVAKAKLMVNNGSLTAITGVNGDKGMFKTKENPNLDFYIGAELKDVKYGMRNMNRSVFYVQNFGDDNRDDTDLESAGNAKDPTRPHAPYYGEYDEVSLGNSFTQSDFDPFYFRDKVDLVAFIGDEFSTDPAYTYRYITENSSRNQMIGNTTYFGIETIVRHIPAKYIVGGFQLGDESKILKERNYVINESTTAFTYEDPTEATSSTTHIVTSNVHANNKNIFYYQRRETTTGITLSSPLIRVFTNQDNAIQAMYINLEAAGFIGTPDNNRITAPVENSSEKRALNHGIWELINGNESNSTIPLTHQKPTGGSSHGAAADAGAAHSLYFEDYTELVAMYNTAAVGDGTRVQGFDHPRIKIISGIYARKFPGQDLTDFFGVYVGARCYYRLNISQNVNAGLLNLVRRNHSYSAKVTGFKNIGEPVLENLDRAPSGAVDQRTTAVTAEITVQAWHDVIIEGDI